MTNPFLDACERWTGDRPDTCMWRALWDDFVGRIMQMFRWCEEGNLAWYAPDPSHREVEGLAYYRQVVAGVDYHAAEERRAKEKKPGQR